MGKDSVSCETIKDAGDDPDATHQALIVSTVSWGIRQALFWTEESVLVG